MANACVFCGDDSHRLTNEHVWGRWLADVVPTEGAGPVVRKPGEGDWEEWRADTFEGKVKIACAACNNGWMNAVEADARPLLTRMVLGRPARLKPLSDQLQVARWAWLKALVVQFTNPSTRLIADSAYSAFCQEIRPPKTSHIWLGYLDRPIEMPDGHGYYITHSRSSSYDARLVHPSDSEFKRQFLQEGNLFSATLIVGRLLMFVLGCDVKAGVIPVDRAKDCFRRIWPLTGTADWPPPRPLAAVSDTAEELAQFFATVEP